MYNSIIKTLHDASIESYESVTHRRYQSKKVVSGWNKHVKEAHQVAKNNFNNWVWHGKPSSGHIYEAMCHSRKIFKSRLKRCQDNAEQIKMDILASHCSNNDFKKFWQCTNKLNIKQHRAECINSERDSNKIANIFKAHFQVSSPMSPVPVQCSLQTDTTTTVQIRSADIKSVIDSMTRGKSPGHDSLSVEHLRHAGCHLPRVLAMFFSLCISHKYLPRDLMRTIVIPIVKCKTADICDNSNYRPISLATILAKVLDNLLNRHLRKNLNLHHAQFGFQPGLSTESAILCMKHTVRYYLDRRTPVYACFLDLSKAFDLVCYEVLWDKLRKQNVPTELVDIFKFWYDNQLNVVKWADCLSEEYRLECGVRQGGSSSPTLFNVYMDSLIGELSSMHAGCYIDGIAVNNISYADDMVLLSPSIGALRNLLSVCERYAERHGLVYNATKSECMFFGLGDTHETPPIVLNGSPLTRVKKIKYLGHIVTDDLKDNEDIERERRALAVRGNMLVRRFARCSANVKLALFKAYCQSFYTSSLWINYTQRAYSALRVQYNNVFRMLLRLPRFCSASAMFADARTNDFYAIRRKRVSSLLSRVRGSSNSILRIISDKYQCPIHSLWVSIVVGTVK